MLFHVRLCNEAQCAHLYSLVLFPPIPRPFLHSCGHQTGHWDSDDSPSLVPSSPHPRAPQTKPGGPGSPPTRHRQQTPLAPGLGACCPFTWQAPHGSLPTSSPRDLRAAPLVALLSWTHTCHWLLGAWPPTQGQAHLHPRHWQVGAASQAMAWATRHMGLSRQTEPCAQCQRRTQPWCGRKPEAGGRGSMCRGEAPPISPGGHPWAGGRLWACTHQTGLGVSTDSLEASPFCKTCLIRIRVPGRWHPSPPGVPQPHLPNLQLQPQTGAVPQWGHLKWVRGLGPPPVPAGLPDQGEEVQSMLVSRHRAASPSPS